jgi:hypothetical protein
MARAWAAVTEGGLSHPRSLWAGFPSHSDEYPAQNFARFTKSPSTVDFVKRAVQTLPSMPELRSARRKRAN